MGLPEHVATLSPELWEVAWKDLVEIVEWGIVSCCISPVPSVRRGVEQQPWSQVSLLWLSPRPSACPDAFWGGWAHGRSPSLDRDLACYRSASWDKSFPGSPSCLDSWPLPVLQYPQTEVWDKVLLSCC